MQRLLLIQHSAIRKCEALYGLRQNVSINSPEGLAVTTVKIAYIFSVIYTRHLKRSSFRSFFFFNYYGNSSKRQRSCTQGHTF